MKRGSKKKSVDGVSCSMLSLQENEQVVELLGRRCVVSGFSGGFYFYEGQELKHN